MASIDIGCGEVKRGDIGIDITLTNSTDIVCSVYDLPFKSESFNEAHAFEVLEHLENPLKALKEINRILIEGAIIHCSIPNVYWCGRIFRSILNINIKKTYTFIEHINSWTIHEMVNLLNLASFKINKYYYGDCGSYRKFFQILQLNKIFNSITNHQLFIVANKSI